MATASQRHEGLSESEVWAHFQGAEGAYQWENCTKNQGHPNFIPASDFTLSHLPEPYRHENIYQLIRLVSDLTVRIRVAYTSSNRPDNYAFSELRGSHLTHTASGMIYPFIRRSESTVCYCPECVDTPKTNKQIWKLSVSTAKHAVFDNEEAKNSVIDMFFDDKSKETQKLYGVSVYSSSIKDDRCVMECTTHDSSLIQKLLNLDYWLCITGDLVYEKYEHIAHAPPLTVIPSHPHGMPKKITVGEWKNRRIDQFDQFGDEIISYKYNTPTCPGSSGAPVLLFGSGIKRHMMWYHDFHLHSAGCFDGLNLSGLWREGQLLI